MKRRFDEQTGLAALPYFTEAISGVGGRLRDRHEDFLVEELPLYQPVGHGEHVYLFVEKRNLATLEMVSIIARHFGVPEKAIGYAGMKDKPAITRQVVSIHVPGKSFEQFPMLEHPQLAVLWADMHTNKLRLGHLRGNRFSIRIRDVNPLEVRKANAILEQLAREGVPNYFGEQRFGARSNNHICGKLLLLGEHARLLDAVLGPDAAGGVLPHEATAAYAAGDYALALAGLGHRGGHERRMLKRLASGWPARRVVSDVPLAQRRLWLNALQSAMFNEVLARRIEAQRLTRVELGDLAQKHDNHAVFRVDETEAAADELQARAARLEISPSGPLWGPEMMQAEGAAGVAELEVLAWAGLGPEMLEAGARAAKVRLPGARRPLRAPLIDPEIEAGVDEHGSFIRCAFELGPGSFATVALREIMQAG